MVDMLRLGSNTLSNLQQALSTTGHNIANVNTEGFSRQTVQFETHDSQQFGFGFVGQGSRVQGVNRSYNDFLTSQVQNFTSNQSQQSAFVEFSSRVDNILANSDASLSASIQKFFTSVNDVAASPSTLPERQTMIGEATNLVSSQQNFQQMLQDLNSEVNAEIRLAVKEVNSLAESISALNKQITASIGSGVQSAPNDLLDQRDKLIKQLSEKISVTTIEQPDASLSVFIGKGQPLVIGGQITRLQTEVNGHDATRLEVGVEGQATINGTSQFVSGGHLQGLLDFRSRVLYPSQSQLGLVALGVSETVNAQHSLGLDLNGNLGQDLFASAEIPVTPKTTNAGTVVPVASLTDVSQVRASDYQVTYDGSQWHMTRLLDNTSIAGAGTLSLDGIEVDVSSGVPSAGDSFILNPARSASANFALQITDPRKIAAASAVTSSVSSGNAGDGKIDAVTVAATNTLPLASPVTLTFNPDALGVGVPGFDVTGGPGGIGPLAYDPATESAGKSLALGATGLSVTVSAVPEAGDALTISNNTGATGDNRNALKLGELQTSATLNGGVDTFQEAYGSMVAQVGVTNSQGMSNLELETSLLQQAEQYKDSVVGVNLDEEAANLMRFQQSYQAAAQLIKVSEDMFQTLMASLR